MVALQILALSVRVRVLLSQQILFVILYIVSGAVPCGGFFVPRFSEYSFAEYSLPTPCRYATSPFQGECGRSLSRLPVPPGRRIAPPSGTAPDGAIARRCRAPTPPLRGFSLTLHPQGTGERIPPHGFAVPFRSASGLRLRFLLQYNVIPSASEGSNPFGGAPSAPKSGVSGAFYPCFRSRCPTIWHIGSTSVR